VSNWGHNIKTDLKNRLLSRLDQKGSQNGNQRCGLINTVSINDGNF
jgi:hypothetical protein